MLKTSDGPITVIVAKINGNRVKIGIEAPKSVQILRSELVPADAGTATKGETK